MQTVTELSRESLLELTQEYQQRNEELEQNVRQLQDDLNALRKLLYAKLRPGTSRFDDSSEGQLFLFGDSAATTTEAEDDPASEEAASKKKTKRGGGRQQLPPGLPRIEEPHSLDDSERLCSCCDPPQELKPIRWEKTEILEYTAAQLVVRVILREVGACPSGMGDVATAPMPPRVVAKGRPGVSLLTHIVISKFIDHLPLHRIAKIFKREQVRIPESTLCDWVGVVADALAPIVVAMKQWLLSQPYIQADETPAKARDPAKKGKLKQIYFFACSLPWQEVIFEYSTNRKAESLSLFLEDFSGEVIQVDEYAGYDRLFREHATIRRAGCWAHAIRKFKAAIKDCDRTASSRQICHLIGQMEGLETLMREKGRVPSARLAVRQRIHVNAVKKMKKLVDQGLADPSIEPKSVYGQAIRYLHNHWPALTTFLEDGRVEMDNNGIEHSIRPLAIGRKNWLHIGHIEAGDRAAVLYSLLATCVRLGIDPREYLCNVLERIPTHPIERIPELTPRNWQAARAAESDSSA